MEIRELTATRVDEIVGRLGFAARPEPDAVGLADLYRAWCRRIPFDNLRKLVALHHDLPEIPGMDPADFFAAWQLIGAGATCWGSTNGLHALLVGLGFDARIHGASMFDVDMNHGTTIVAFGAERWLVDTALHTDAPLPLIDGQVSSVEHAGTLTTANPDPGGWLIECTTSDPGARVICRIHDPIDHATAVLANEKSRVSSPFNDGIMAAINDESGMWKLRNGTLTRIERSGPTMTSLTASEVDDFLIEVTGHAPQLVAEVREALAARD
jgi:N-hydroxyarylamine O-acetyltransferase